MPDIGEAIRAAAAIAGCFRLILFAVAFGLGALIF
jgi:hypothetical protein